MQAGYAIFASPVLFRGCEGRDGADEAKAMFALTLAAQEDGG